jgi:hypothetical protein
VPTYNHSLQPKILNDNVNQFKVGLESDKGYFTLKVKTMTLMSHFFWPQFFLLYRPKNFGRHCLSIQKKIGNPYFIVIMITVLIMNVIFWVVNFKTQNYFVISTTQNVYLRLSMCTTALILFIHVGFL